MSRVIILGAGNVGRTLLDILEQRKHKIIIVDEDKEVCNDIATEKSVLAVHGDVSDPKTLDELDLPKADYVFAITGTEESNFLSAIYAKQAGAKKVICRVDSLKHSKILDTLGIESVVSEFTLASELANRASSPAIHCLLNPLESKLEFIEKKADKGMVSKSIKHLQENKNYLIIAIREPDDSFKLAFPTERLKEGSTLIMIRERGFKLF
jgi:trk system potassium uptake protein